MTWSFSSVSSDEIRAQETQKIVAQGKFNQEQAFERSRQPANKQYKSRLINIIKGTQNLTENSVHVAYLDKNHPPNGGIENVTSLIDEQMPTGVEYAKVYLVPLIQQATVPGYPLSYECIGQCLYNGSKRENHETLDNTDVPKLFAI